MGAAAEELIKLAARLIFQQLATPYRAAFERRIGAIVVCGMLAFIAGLAGVVCGVAAFWLWLAPLVGAAVAGLICAAILLMAALILGLSAMHFARRSPTAALTEMLTSNELGSTVEKHIPELVIAAAVGGLILGLRRKKK
jgi:hypothetical protein